MSMIEVKTTELIGASLRYAVAVACGWQMQRIEDGIWEDGEPHWWQVINEKAVVPGKSNGLVGYIKPGAKGATSGYDYCPDVKWSQGGPLIASTCTALNQEQDGAWWAHAMGANGLELGEGETMLIAACRAIVAAKLGEVVGVPEELVQQPTEDTCDE